MSFYAFKHLRDKRKSNWKGRTNNNYNNKQHQSLFVDQHRQDETQHLESRATPSLRAKNQHHMEIITLKNWRKSKEEEQNAHKQTKKVFTRKKKSILLALNEEGWTKRAKQQPEEQKNASATYSVKNCNQEYFLIYGVHKNTHSRFFMYYNNNKVWKKNKQLNKNGTTLTVR